MTYHKIKDKFQKEFWVIWLQSWEHFRVAEKVASALFKRTLGEPHWCQDFDKGCPRAIATHPFKLYPKHELLFEKLAQKDGAVYINKVGGIMPLDTASEVLEIANCAHWPSEDIKGIISKWTNGKHWYVNAEGVTITKSHKYREKFNSIKEAKDFLKIFMPESAIKVEDSFQYATIGD